MVDGVHQSAISTWLECREKARLRYLLNLDTEGISKPIMFGDLSHMTIAKCYKAIAEGKITTLSGVDHEVPRWLQEAKVEQVANRGELMTDEQDTQEEAIGMLEALLPLYFAAWWSKDKDECDWESVERRFSVERIAGGQPLPAPLAGTYDGVFRRRKTKKLWLLETKNKGRWSARMADFLPLDLQVNIYAAAMRSEAALKSNPSADEPAGVRYNLLRRPQERRKQGESLKDYVDRIRARAIKEPEHFFERLDMAMTRQDVDAACRRTEALIREFMAWFDSASRELGDKDLLLNAAACESKYGICQYLGACSGGSLVGLKTIAPHR
jgi:hypothetical protein